MFYIFFLIVRPPPSTTRTYTLLPYTTLFRSDRRLTWRRLVDADRADRQAARRLEGSQRQGHCVSRFRYRRQLSSAADADPGRISRSHHPLRRAARRALFDEIELAQELHRDQYSPTHHNSAGGAHSEKSRGGQEEFRTV